MFLTRVVHELHMSYAHWESIPGPVSCRCPGGLLETPARWHKTICCAAHEMLQERSDSVCQKLKSSLFYDHVHLCCNHKLGRYITRLYEACPLS